MGARAVSLARNLAYRVGVFIAAVVGGMVGLPVAVLGLAVPFFVILPLTLIVGGLLSGISASWAANLLAPDRTRSILLPITGASVAAGTVVAVAGIVLSMGGAWRVFPNLFSALLLFMAIIATGTSFAAWHFRRIDGQLTRDLMITIGLLGAAVAVIPGTIFTTCSLMVCGP